MKDILCRLGNVPSSPSRRSTLFRRSGPKPPVSGVTACLLGLSLGFSAVGCGSSSPLASLAPAPLETVGQPRELGQVHWIRGFEQAATKASATEKPILLLFQEVPG